MKIFWHTTSFSFMNGKSTEDAKAALIDNVVHKLDNIHKCIEMFLDLTNAFPNLFIKWKNLAFVDYV